MRAKLTKSVTFTSVHVSDLVADGPPPLLCVCIDLLTSLNAQTPKSGLVFSVVPGKVRGGSANARPQLPRVVRSSSALPRGGPPAARDGLRTHGAGKRTHNLQERKPTDVTSVHTRGHAHTSREEAHKRCFYRCCCCCRCRCHCWYWCCDTAVNHVELWLLPRVKVSFGD